MKKTMMILLSGLILISLNTFAASESKFQTFNNLIEELREIEQDKELMKEYPLFKQIIEESVSNPADLEALESNIIETHRVLAVTINNEKLLKIRRLSGALMDLFEVVLND